MTKLRDAQEEGIDFIFLDHPLYAPRLRYTRKINQGMLRINFLAAQQKDRKDCNNLICSSCRNLTRAL